MLELPVGYGEVTFVWHLDGDAQDMTFSLGYRPIPHSTVVGDIEGAGGALVSDYQSNLFPSGASDIFDGWTLERAQVRAHGATGDITVNDVSIGLTGTATGGTVPNIMALLVRKKTASGGRKHRGRLFHPPVNFSEDGVGNTGSLNNDEWDVQQDLWTALMAASGTLYELVLLHSAPGDTPDIITDLQPRRRLAIQRRRYTRV